jgi:hypothetical protein
MEGALRLIIGMMILWQMGSRKFGSFLVVTTLVATTFEMAALLYFDLVPASGPFSVIYGLFVLYYCQSMASSRYLVICHLV